MKTISILLFSFCISNGVWAEGWDVMHPGGGGQVQGIYFDPNIDGKMFFSSDMEGVSLSTDGGLTWIYTGRTLKHLNQLCTEVDPGDSDRVYSGGMGGLDLSDDGGYTWSYVDYFVPLPSGSGRGSIGAIAVDPSNSDKVYVAHGWKDESGPGAVTGPTQSATGPREVAYSLDRGVTWQSSAYEGSSGYKNCYTIEVHPSNGHVYLGADAGLYRSTNSGASWSKLPTPSGYQTCLGAALTANGDYIYAVYKKNSTYKLFGSLTSSISWQDVSGTLSSSASWWAPRVDKRDTGSSHHVLLSALHSVSALWEGTVSWTGGSASPTWRQLFNSAWTSPWSYDGGWRHTQPKCRHKDYTPASWSQRRAWTSDDEGIYVGNPDGNIYTSWEPRYCENVGGGKYQSRGIDCTWVWDVDGDGQDYFCQGQADNGFIESHDNGAGWKRNSPNQLAGCTAIEVLHTPTKLVVVGAQPGYGGGYWDSIGSLFSKTLNGGWVLIAGGSGGKNGLNGNGGDGPRIATIGSDPFQPERIYIGTTHGVYRHDNVTALHSGINSSFVRISNTTTGFGLSKRIVCDPNDANVVYLMNSSGVFRSDNAHAASPAWVKIHNETGTHSSDKELCVWDHEGTTYLVIGDDNGSVYLTANPRATAPSFSTVLTQNEALTVHPTSLEPWWENGYSLRAGAVAARGDTIYVFLAASYRHGYATLRGALTGGTDVVWEDWTGVGEDSMHYTWSRRAVVVDHGTNEFVYAATCGMGSWRRDTSEDAPPPVVPGPPEAPANQVLRTSSAPVLDGLADAVWSNAPARAIEKLIQGINPVPADLSGVWQALWDEQNLYLLATITDDDPVVDSAQFYDDDTVEIYLDGNLSGGGSYDGTDDYQLLFRVDAAILAGYYSVPNVSGMLCAAADAPAGYVLEMAIPWDRIGQSPTNGLSIGFDIAVNDDDDGGSRDSKLSWNSATDVQWSTPSSFGQVTMVNDLKLGYYDWISGFSVADEDPSANDDGDELCHYLEYLLGGNPELNDADQLVDYAMREIDGINYFSALYVQNPQALGIAHAECSAALEQWDPAVPVVTTNAHQLLERDLVPTDSATNRFLRLKAEW